MKKLLGRSENPEMGDALKRLDKLTREARMATVQVLKATTAVSKFPDHAGVIQLLLEHGADVNAQAKDGSTPLHEASRFGTAKTARLLLEHGASVEVKDAQGRTPIQVASTSRNAEVMELLLEHGAKWEPHA